MTLRCLLQERFFPLNPQITHKRTREHYWRAIEHLCRVLGREAMVCDLCDDNVLLVMSDCLSHGLSVVTANHRRKCLCSIWNWCSRRGMIPLWPSVRKLREPKRAPRAWTEDELKRLIESCMKCTGDIGGVPAANWWLALHGYLWDSASRTSEALQLRWEWLDLGRGLAHVPAFARKGKSSDAVYQLMSDTVYALELIRQPVRELVFHWPGHPSALYKRYATILRRAGLPADRYSMPQKMRRSHASHLALAGGDATASLGHSSDYVTRCHYLDNSLTNEAPAAKLFRILPQG